MELDHMFKRLQTNIKKYTRPFWVLIFAAFIDGLGGSMLWPFFSLFFINRFPIGVTEVGFIFSLFSVGMLLGSVIGGAFADKFGRKSILLFGIIVSGLANLLNIIVMDLRIYYGVAFLMGLLGSLGQPAQNAMVADLLPPELQADGYGIFRIAMNITVVIGPVLGGLLAAFSFNWLFIADAVASSITGVIVIFAIPETKPENVKKEEKQTFGQTLRGYGHVLRDGAFMFFMLLGAMVSLVYMQMNSTLSVFLNQEYAFSLQDFSYLLAMNALMVVILQFPITRIVSKGSPMIMAALGAILYAIGFGMYGFVQAKYMFYIAMVIITIGEMIITPVSTMIVARLAPEDKPGRYMAVYGLSWIIPSLFGVILAGLIMDNLNPNWLWYIGGILTVFSAIGFLFLIKMTTRRFKTIDEELQNSVVDPISEQ